MNISYGHDITARPVKVVAWQLPVDRHLVTHVLGLAISIERSIFSIGIFFWRLLMFVSGCGSKWIVFRLRHIERRLLEQLGT